MLPQPPRPFASASALIPSPNEPTAPLLPPVRAALVDHVQYDQLAGQLRSTARAVLLFDHSLPHWESDLKRLGQALVFTTEVGFDEEALCRARYSAEMQRRVPGLRCSRAKGKFTLAEVLIRSLPSPSVAEKPPAELIRADQTMGREEEPTVTPTEHARRRPVVRRHHGQPKL